MSTICIVSEELNGLKRGGGIGVCVRGFVEHLLSLGLYFDVLITDLSLSQSNAAAEVTERFNCIFLSDFAEKDTVASFPFDAISKAYSVFRFLKTKSYTVIHFNDFMGSGFYVAMARRQGLFPSLIVTHLRDSSKWRRLYNFSAPSLESFECEALERSQIENSDCVISPSQFLLDWYSDQGVCLPKASKTSWILPLWVQDPVLNSPLITGGLGSKGIKELIFLGRHERRKGFDLFVDAVSGLPASLQCPITFIGRFSRIDAEFTGARALRRLADYGGGLRFLDNLGPQDALAFIKQSPEAICVMPSLSQNSSCTVGECLTLGHPFLATDVGGVSELIEPSSRPHCLVEPNVKSLREGLIRVLSDGQQAIISALAPARIRARWTEQLHNLEEQFRSAPQLVCQKPLVSVCVIHHERPYLLHKAIDAIQAQTYEAIEIILVDDGSESEAARIALAEIENGPTRFPLSVIRSQNQYLGAARNLAASQANGEFLIFQDDDNVAEPNEVALFVQAALSSGADILTTQAFIFDESEDFRDSRKIGLYPIGIGGLFSFFRNRFGDANALIRRETFLKIGGFTELRDVGLEDWEFFLKAYLRGSRMGVVAEPLFHYRVNSNGMLATGNLLLNHERIYSAIDEYQPRIGGDLLRYANAKALNEQIRDRLISCNSKERGHDILQELVSLDPDSTEAKVKLSDYAFEIGRYADALDLGLPSAEQLATTLAHSRPNLKGHAMKTRRQIIGPSERHDAITLKGWIFEHGGALPEITHLLIARKKYKVVAMKRGPRIDVQRQFELPDSAHLGFTLVAIPVSSRLERLNPLNLAFRIVSGSADIDLPKIRFLVRSSGRWQGYIDFGQWLQRSKIDLSSNTWIIETSIPTMTFIDCGNGNIDFGSELSERCRRFAIRSEGHSTESYKSELTALLPTSLRSDITSL